MEAHFRVEISSHRRRSRNSTPDFELGAIQGGLGESGGIFCPRSSIFPLPLAPQTRVMVVREHPVSSVAPKLAFVPAVVGQGAFRSFYSRGSLVAQLLKNLPAMQETLV